VSKKKKNKILLSGASCNSFFPQKLFADGLFPIFMKFFLENKKHIIYIVIDINEPL